MKNKTKVKDYMFYIDVLKSEECQCDREKRKKFALCFKCYQKLPSYKQSGLWRKIGNGFEEAYDSAVEYLND